MTTTDCYVALVGLKDHTDLSNPEPFRTKLPRPEPGHYWAPAVENFAKARHVPVRYTLDNLTPEITVTGPQLRTLLVDAYGEDHAFLAGVAPYLTAVHRYRVYAEDF